MPQSKKDSVTISKAARNNMYARALQADALDSLLVIANERIVNLKSDFDRLQVKDSAIIANYDKQLKEAEGQKELLKQTIADKDKQIRRERFKRKLATIGGVITTGIVSFLLITK